MREYGVESVERDEYRKGGESVEVQGIRFQDASGAYGGFTYFRTASFHAFALNLAHEQAAATSGEIVFTRGPWLILIHTGSTGASFARALARAIPISSDAALALPELPQDLPSNYQLADSVHYSEGPAAFSASCPWLGAGEVGFNQSAEAVVATYNLPHRPAGAQLLLISYPTPQIARTHFEALSKSGGDFVLRRSGPFLLVVHGLTRAQAAPLLESVNYDATFTRIPPKYVGLEGLPAFILAVFALCAFVIGVSIVLGVITGALHAWVQPLLPERFRHHRDEAMIQLRLSAHPAETSRSRPG